MQSRISCFRLKLISCLFCGYFANGLVKAQPVIEVISLQNRSGFEMEALLTPLLETGDVVNADGFNLIVKSSPEQLDKIRKLIEKLDTRLHNLLISVQQTSHKTAEQLNAESSLAISTGQIRMQGIVADTRDLDSLNTKQQIRILEGQPAHIQFGQMRPITNVNVYNSGYGYPAVSHSTQLQEASTGFAVIPHLNGNNTVLLDIAPWSDRFLNNGGLVMQSVETTLNVPLGEWIEIGSKNDQQMANTHEFNGLNYNARNNDVRILIKVELLD